MRQKGVLQISNPTANVTFSISGLAIYTISGVATNATINGSISYVSTIAQGSSVTLNVGANGTTYKLPQSISVTNATGTYTRTSDTEGTLVITNPTGAVSFSVVGETLLDLTGTQWQLKSSVGFGNYYPHYIATNWSNTTWSYDRDIGINVSVSISGTTRTGRLYFNNYYKRTSTKGTSTTSLMVNGGYQLAYDTFEDLSTPQYWHKYISITRRVSTVITITGGTGVSDVNVYNWLLSNATRIS